MAHDTEPLKQKLGLWLARQMLRLTGNRELANASTILSLIPKRRLAISPEALDLQKSGLLSGTEWRVWDPSGVSPRPISEESS